MNSKRITFSDPRTQLYFNVIKTSNENLEIFQSGGSLVWTCRTWPLADIRNLIIRQLEEEYDLELDQR